MATKKIVQDIVPNKKHSIREISLDDEVVTRPRINKRKPIEKIEVEEEIELPKKPRYSKKRKITLKHVLTSVIIFVSVAVIAIALSLSYSKAVVTITPKVVSFDINGTFTAKKGTTSTDLGYEVVTVTSSSTQRIPATKGPLVQTKARGTVIIYNNYSQTAQALVAGTRVATPDGLVYRTTSSVTVPGKKTTPGSVVATVVADQAGAKYNLKVTALNGDFRLPGYKGSPKYNGFYARIRTDIVGGFSGNKMTIDPTLKTKTVDDLKEVVKAELIAKLNQSIPTDYVLYDTSYNIEYDVPEPIMTGTSEADIVVRGSAHGAIFKTDSLIKFIAGSEIRKFPSDTYEIDGEKELAFKVSNVKDFSAKKGTPLIFTLKGPIKITGMISEDKLKSELQGTKLRESASVFARYQSISNAHALITPFWLRSFPNSPERINIEYKH
jgi:hypothetical protein